VSFVSFVFLAAIGLVQAPNPPAPRLLAAKSAKCDFTTLATGTWKNGVAEAATKPVALSLAFTAIDTQDGTAEAISSGGRAHITVRVIGNYLNLMQVDPYGAVYVTTVFNAETRNGRLAAAHTRHEYLAVQVPTLTSRPEQYYGDCEIK
jgi:hypothetical protein